MKAFIVLLAISTFLTFSCSEDPAPGTVCSVNEPVEDLDWLAAEIQIMAESGMAQALYVSQAQYRFETVFIFRNCCTLCLSIIPVYNCSGDHIGNVQSGDIDPNILDHDVVIWKAVDSSCIFQ